MSALSTVTCLLAAVLVPLTLGYDEKFDKFDVDKVLADEELFNGYIDCLLDHAPCSYQYGDEFKKLLPEVVATACSKCSPIQKDHFRKSVKALQQRKPESFQEFKKKYDPNGEHEANFAAFLVASD